jgi:hypothetical protein
VASGRISVGVALPESAGGSADPVRAARSIRSAGTGGVHRVGICGFEM